MSVYVFSYPCIWQRTSTAGLIYYRQAACAAFIDLGEILLPVEISVCPSVHLSVFVSLLHLHVGYNRY